MSTDAADAAEPSRKKAKHKKSKDNTDNTKKRKREEQAAAAEATVETQQDDRPPKKSKKDEKKARFAVEPVEPRKDLLEQHSPFVKQTTSLYLPLSPCAHDFALEGLCAEHISPLILTYFPPLKGIMLSYENPRMSEHASESAQVNGSKAILSRSINEYAVTYVWLTAEFTVFKPRRGTYLEGHVNIQNESMLGLVCYNYFNAVIQVDKLPEDWKWVEDDEDAAPDQTTKKRAIQGAGHFENGAGEVVDGKIVFRVEDFDASPGSDGGPGTVSIHGTLRFGREET